MLLTRQQFSQLIDACRALPEPEGDYPENNYVMELLETVLNLRMRRTIVTNCLEHFRTNCSKQMRTFSHLRYFLSRNRDDAFVAQHLWGRRYSKRVSRLRGLLSYFESIGVTSKNALRKWGTDSEFHRDFEGRVPSLAIAACQYLVMRLGRATVKPDVHVRRFVEGITHARLADEELVAVVEKVAKAIGLRANDLDLKIWDYQRRLGGEAAIQGCRRVLEA
jgi:hypothetical protein